MNNRLCGVKIEKGEVGVGVERIIKRKRERERERRRERGKIDHEYQYDIMYNIRNQLIFDEFFYATLLLFIPKNQIYHHCYS